MPSATPESSKPRIVLGVAGGIAAYKSVELLRLLRDANYHVAPVLTPDATRFVGAVTFSALASEPARTQLFGDPTTPIPHTYLGRSADLIVVAPATAHLIARYATGLADDLLSATLLATKAPVLLCTAMHTEMWSQPSVQENLATLRRRGVMVLEPDVGHLAGGDVGVGRMAEPAAIFELVEAIVRGYRGTLSGRRVLISAGGTREAIDPVRVISNRSSGRQGYALAEVAHRLGASVTLVTTVDRGPGTRRRGATSTSCAWRVPNRCATPCSIASRDSDCAIMAAAVGDFSVKPETEKIKKDTGLPSLQLELTPDIVLELVACSTRVADRRRLRRRDDERHGERSSETTAQGRRSPGRQRRRVAGCGLRARHERGVVLGRDGVAETVSLRSKEAVSYGDLG